MLSTFPFTMETFECLESFDGVLKETISLGNLKRKKKKSLTEHVYKSGM